MAEIKIRNVPIDIVKKLDEQYKKKGFKSREEYLRDRLLYISEEEDLFEVEKKYSKIVNEISEVLKDNTIALNKFLKFNLIDLESEVSKKNE